MDVYACTHIFRSEDSFQESLYRAQVRAQPRVPFFNQPPQQPSPKSFKAVFSIFKSLISLGLTLAPSLFFLLLQCFCWWNIFVLVAFNWLQILIIYDLSHTQSLLQALHSSHTEQSCPLWERVLITFKAFSIFSFGEGLKF